MQFDVYTNSNEVTRERFPYLLDVQAELLDALETRMIIPLRSKERMAGRPLDRLMPEVQLPGGVHVLSTPHMASMPRKWLGPRVANLNASRDAIVAALDLLLTGV